MTTDSPQAQPELKPCPFCGGEAVRLRDGRVFCGVGKCATFYARFATPEQWNTRADLSRVQTGLTVEAWQPIETAPRDEGYYQLVARFEDGKLLWWEKAKPVGDSNWKSRGGYVVPTHWREVK